jgi:CRP-like cAMP-binding protein
VLYCPTSVVDPVLEGWSWSQARRVVGQWREHVRLVEPTGYRKGSALSLAGEAAHDMFLMIEGIAGLSYALSDETAVDVLFSLAYPGHLITVQARDDERSGPITISALTPCKAYRLNVRTVRGIADRDPEVAALLQRSLHDELIRGTEALAESLALPPTKRLDKLLREVRVVLGRNHVPVRDDELAMLLGLSVRHLKRVKRTLEPGIKTMLCRQ